MGTTGKVKARWTRSFFTNLNTQGDEERYSCDICQKDFASPSNLTLHSQVHVIERKYRCEPCQVSFHSLGHLQKHKRSSAHESRSQMTQAFGLPTSDNPRPYGCSECDTAFRKHGHLAKHLRSKSHITRLESRGLIPTGTYVALEKSGQDLKDKLVTTNYEQSLVSMREIAMQLFQNQMLFNEQIQQPPMPQQAPMPAYGPLSEPPIGGNLSVGVGSGSGSGNGIGGSIDNQTDMMIAHFASSSAQQQQPILSPGYFSSSSLSPPLPSQPQQQQPLPPPPPPPTSSSQMLVPQSAVLPAASMMGLHHQHHQHHQSINPRQDHTIFQHLQHQQLPTSSIAHPNDLAGTQMMAGGGHHHHHHHMIPQHQQAAHSLDYTMRHHQY